MTATIKRKATAPKITGAEIFILTILVLFGAGGGFLAQQQLAALRAEAALRPLDDSGPGGTAGVGGGSLSASVGDGEAAPVEPDLPAPAVAAQASRPTGAQSASIRSQSLLTIADLVSKRVLVPGQPPVQAGVAAARGGPPVPAYMIGPDGKLPAAFGQLFGISDGDVAMLQATATSIQEQAQQLIAANTSVVPTGPDTYAIEVRPAPEAQALRSQFESAFRGVLGDDGFRAFSLLNGERELPAGRVGGPAAMQLSGIAAMFGGFGNDTKTITVTKLAATGAAGPMGQQPRYQFSIKSGTSNGGGSGLKAALQNLDTRVGFPVTKLLPDDF